MQRQVASCESSTLSMYRMRELSWLAAAAEIIPNMDFIVLDLCAV